MSFNISLLRTVIAFSTELRGYSATILGRSADDTLPPSYYYLLPAAIKSFAHPGATESVILRTDTP